MASQDLIVPPLNLPLRLDTFLVRQIPDTSRRFWKTRLQEVVTVNGVRPKKGMLLHGGERIGFSSEIKIDPLPLPDEQVEVKIVNEDPSFLVVDKPAGIPSHPLKEGERGTLIQGVLAHYPEIAAVGPSRREMGLVHRLDNETSGLILIARDDKAYGFLREEFKRRRVEKEYLALVAGKMRKTGEGKWERIDWPIAHHPKNKRKMVICVGAGFRPAREGRQAVTYYKVEKVYPAHTLLRVRIPTGVRHQIRVHLAQLGYPIVGDVLYGGVGAPCKVPLQGRFFLHACRLAFRHPRTLKKEECLSGLPQDLTPLLALFAKPSK